MDAFAVKCVVPEVFEMLEALAVKAGYVVSPTVNRNQNFYWSCAGKVENYSTEGLKRHGTRVIDLDSAIEFLRKPVVLPIMIADRKLKFPGDGTIVLSCGTVLGADLCEEINRRRITGGE